MKIRSVGKGYISELVHLHMSFLPGTASVLGEDYMTHFYEKICNQNKYVVLGAFEKNELVGFIVGTAKIADILDETHPTVKTLIYLLQAMIHKKIRFLYLLQRLLFESLVKRYVRDAHGYIFVLVVESNYQRRGIGGKLVTAAGTHLPYPLWVDTRRENINAVRFYRKHGFTPRKEAYGSVLFLKKQHE